MCNEVARRIALGQLRDDWSQTGIELRFPEALPNLAPLDSIRITDTTLIIRAPADDGSAAVAVMRRWSWPGPTGKPVYNYRSEGRSLVNHGAKGGRCLIPVDGFYEFTSSADPKAKRKDKWHFAHATDAWFCVAGLWRTDPKVGEAFTMLTTEPGPDIAPYHSRQIVLMPKRDWGAWIAGAVPAETLIAPTPAGTLTVMPAGTPVATAR